MMRTVEKAFVAALIVLAAPLFQAQLGAQVSHWVDGRGHLAPTRLTTRFRPRFCSTPLPRREEDGKFRLMSNTRTHIISLERHVGLPYTTLFKSYGPMAFNRRY
jgi:hypothetical protein